MMSLHCIHLYALCLCLIMMHNEKQLYTCIDIWDIHNNIYICINIHVCIHACVYLHNPQTKITAHLTSQGHQFWLTLLSPVTTMTRMPAVIHESIALLTSSLGGSSIPTFKSIIRKIMQKKKKKILMKHVEPQD